MKDMFTQDTQMDFSFGAPRVKGKIFMKKEKEFDASLYCKVSFV